MKMTSKVKKVLAWYESDNPGTKASLARMLMQGKLAGTGKLIILPVDQGFEHGPVRSFGMNPAAYDPHYHFQLAIDSGCSAYCSVLGMLEAGADTFAGQIPLVLKMNSSNSLYPTNPKDTYQPNQAVTASVKDAQRLGCSAIGFTIYPGSGESLNMYEEIRELIREAKAAGIATIIWSYPRGAAVSKEGETALDVCTYGAHMAALLGAHVIKVKLPTDHLEQDEAKKVYTSQKIGIKTMAERVAHVKQATFNGKRLVIFSGGTTKGDKDVYDDIQAIAQGGGDGSIMGRNVFQRPREESLEMLAKIMDMLKK
jgi:fructose-bisphosphate aldolase, class I